MTARLEYPAKVLLAWGEAISGNTDLRDWLMRNGYPELGLFTFALVHDRKARTWLLENGYPHLMALISGVEGDEGALRWLGEHGFGVLKHMALAGDGEAADLEWLVQHGHRELAVIARKIHKVKTDLDDEQSDIHRFPRT